MAFVYAQWRSQSTLQARYDMLCLHIGELQELGVGAGDFSADGKSRGNSSAVVHLASLIKTAEQYENDLGIGAAASRVSRVEVRRGSK